MDDRGPAASQHHRADQGLGESKRSHEVGGQRQLELLAIGFFQHSQRRSAPSVAS